MQKIPLSIYIHIPFCAKKCNYCDFLSVCNADDLMNPYVEALCRHITASAGNFTDYKLVSVFFGGGTPTTLPVTSLIRILDCVRDNFNAGDDISIASEANPETVDEEYLETMRLAGFNRISFGVQSFEDRLLAPIGRIHSAERAVKAVNWAKKAGFDDISIDLIFALPHQTLKDFEQSLDTAVHLPITHISCYALTVESGTALALDSTLLNAIPNENDDRLMYHTAINKLQSAGFEHYEISNWAKPGYICRHNLGYWTGRQYAGFGVGSHSFVKNIRYTYTDNLHNYIDGSYAPIILENVDTASAMSEFIILGLRLTDGVSTNDFNFRFGQDIFSVFGQKIEKLISQELLAFDKDRLYLTKQGFDLSNTVFSDFL